MDSKPLLESYLRQMSKIYRHPTGYFLGWMKLNDTQTTQDFRFANGIIARLQAGDKLHYISKRCPAELASRTS